MTDFININERLEKLHEYVNYLKGYQGYSVEDLKKDHTLQGAVLHYLQLSIECVIDIGELIISRLKFSKPDQAREVIKILGDNKILTDDFASRFCSVAGFRNILVHEYAEVDLNIVHSYLQNSLKDFDIFAQSIAKFIKSKDV